MKKILLLLFVCFPIAMLAQTDAKYMEGSVPVIDGKVTFTSEINIPGMSQEQIYEIILQWANDRYQPDQKFNDRILYQNAEKGNIIVGGEEYIIFSQSALSLDRSRIYYRMQLSCQPEKCVITMNRIHYWYEETRNGGEKHTAEEWITDKYAMNKSKTKLYPAYGKFRKKTIDLKDDIINEIQSIVGKKILAQGIQASSKPSQSSTAKEQPLVPLQPAIPVQEIQPAQNVQPTTTNNIETLIAQAVRITITAGNDEQFEINKEYWGGFGEFFGKQVIYLLIDTQKTIGNLLMTQNDNYSISFYTSNDRQPSVVISCKKLITQNIKGEEAQKMNPSCSEQKSYNMYVGEILK